MAPPRPTDETNEDAASIEDGVAQDFIEEDEEELERMYGERPLDDEEASAEENAEDLMDDGEGYLADQTDMLRERAAFAQQGINPDEYDEDLLDDETSYGALDPKARRAAERRMRMRDQRAEQDALGKSGRHLGEGMRRLLAEDDLEDDIDEIDERRRARREAFSRVAMEASVPSTDNVNYAKKVLSSPPKETAWSERIEEAAVTLFRFFLHQFSLDNEFEEDTEAEELKGDSRKVAYYVEKIWKMIKDSSTSLSISTKHLIAFHCRILVPWIAHKPIKVTEVLSDVITAEAGMMSPEVYGKKSCSVRLEDWPYSTQLRNLRCFDLNSMVKVSGVVTRRSSVFPRLKVMFLTCTGCGSTMNEQPVLFIEGQTPNMPNRCINCQRSTFIVDRVKTLYEDFQKLTLQESPGSVPAGRAPRQREVIVLGELADSVKPGEEVEVLGVYQTRYDIGLNVKMGFPVFATNLLANNINRKEEIRLGELTEEDIDEIKKLSRDKHIRERIIASIAPSLWGHKQVKTAVAYALFGGVPKGRPTPSADPHSSHYGGGAAAAKKAGGHTIRGDINVLLLGDPGLGKSQALHYVHKTFHRTVLTTGKGASAVGLTAGVRRDPASGEYTLEGGALVLADEGICLIDEFDKMTDKDRVSIHEAMEQQSISISKAGIVTTLRARCSVIAAANPRYGRYEPSLTFKENVDLSDPILSRFDLIAVIRDVPNVDSDFSLAEYVVTNHMLTHPHLEDKEEAKEEIARLEKALHGYQAYEPIPQDLLQKYILYARTNCRPELGDLGSSKEKMTSFYSRVRQRAMASGGFPMTLRHVESMIRIAEANAKMRLAHTVNSMDIDYAIATMLDSFISSQKYAVAVKLGREFARYRALARGGYELLGEIASRCMQQLVERSRVRDRQYGKDWADFEIRSDVALLPLNYFKKLAKEQSFTDYNLDSWFKSQMFHQQFEVIKRDRSEYLVSKTYTKFGESGAGEAMRE